MAIEQVENKYLPSPTERKLIIKTQIAESQKIIYRSYLDVVEGEATNNDQLVTSSEYSIRTLKKKIDILEKELANLE